ncbi:hypothetical protein BGX29_001916 [Mortierella sp. GBA35]|nr:hypothetical protein BGX29_001916 [Mortierella sp. GBA35]
MICDSEAKKLVAAFGKGSNATTKSHSLEGTKFDVRVIDENKIGGQNGATGFVAAKSKEYVIVGYYDKNQDSGDRHSRIADMCEKTISIGV